MNVNEEMNELGKMGSVGYAASDQVVDQLHTRAKRARRVRRSSAALVGSLGAMVLGVFGAQVIVDFDTDASPGDLDRSKIEQGLGNNFDGGKYSNDAYKGDVDIDEIMKNLEVSSKTETEKPKKETKKHEPKTEPKDEPKDEPKEECEDYDYGPDKPYKYWDCSKGKWRIKAGWYWDEYADSYQQCDASGEGASYDFGYYDCDNKKWYPNVGWVVFHDIFAECKTYSDAATGSSFNAGYIIADSWKKMVKCSPSQATFGSQYRYVWKNGDTLGSVSGATCTGKTIEKKGAPHQYSCNPSKDEWVLSDSNYKWFKEDGCGGWYYHKDDVVDWNGKTWEWIGGEWVDTTPVDPEPSP